MKEWGVDDHKLPPNETTTRLTRCSRLTVALGVKLRFIWASYFLLDEWLDSDENLDKWEGNQLSASDRRILLACWYDKAVKKALEGDAKWKYFQHAGALLTADGSDDELIKFE